MLRFIKKLNKTKSRQIPKRCSLGLPKAYVFFQFILLQQTEDILPVKLVPLQYDKDTAVTKCKITVVSLNL